MSVISAIILLPRLTSTTTIANVLLDETVTFSEEFYEQDFYLQLAKGEKINVKLDANGQPVGFRISDPDGMTVNDVDLIDIYTYEDQMIAPVEGTYTFYVGTVSAGPKVHIIITKV
ncbi:MAG TPA: hypothetical protein VIH48_02790 [Candidatus Bathyarchaeia archaeon]